MLTSFEQRSVYRDFRRFLNVYLQAFDNQLIEFIRNLVTLIEYG